MFCSHSCNHPARHININASKSATNILYRGESYPFCVPHRLRGGVQLLLIDNNINAGKHRNLSDHAETKKVGQNYVFTRRHRHYRRRRPPLRP